MKRYQKLAITIQARHNCIKMNNTEWLARHEETIEEIMQTAPSGNGFDAGTEIDMGKSTDNKIVLHTSFHHMDEWGGYDGWTEHDIIVRSHLVFDIDLTIKGRNRNNIKEYITEVFNTWLTEEV